MSEPLLRVGDLRLRRGATEVLRSVSFSLAAGERVALMGLSGGGKTTTLRAIVALEPFDQGEIAVNGFTLRPGRLPGERHLRPLRERVGMVFQAHDLFAHLSALENIMLAPVHAFGMSREEAERRAAGLLDSLGVAGRSGALPRDLSGGESQRVAIARALVLEPSLLLMDEPTAALDPARRGDLAQLLRSLADRGRALLVSTHDVDFAKQFASRVLVLAGGTIVEQGPPEAILGNPRHEATRRLLLGEWEE